MNQDPEEHKHLVRARGGTRASRRKRIARELDLSTVGMVFPVALLLGYFGGGLIGGWVGASRGGSWIGLGLGLLSGFYNLFKVALMLQRRERRASEGGSTEDGDTPTPTATRARD